LISLTAAALLLVNPLTAQALPPRYSVRKGFGRYYAFDLLWRDGDLRMFSQIKRKQASTRPST
jgi:hypothetical protein